MAPGALLAPRKTCSVCKTRRGPARRKNHILAPFPSISYFNAYDRAGKQPDGSAKTREAKVVTIWTAESRDNQGKPMRDPGSVTYSAAIESAAARDTDTERSDFAGRVLREATRRSFAEALRCVALGDGSTWIWNTATELFPQAIPILDRYHAKETLHRTAQSIFGAISQEAKLWATARCTELDDGK